MSVDKELAALSGTIEEGQPWPRPSCPNCATGHVRFGIPVETESYRSASVRNHWAFEPEWVHGTFSVLGECENPSCRQFVHGIGEYNVEIALKSVRDDPWDDGQPTYSSYYQIRNLHPPLHLMPVPLSAPEELRDGVLRASRVLFADAGLAATALRAVVERFLTTEGIALSTSAGQFRNAHQRIEDWRAGGVNRAAVADLFLAVKWLGNAGTHEDSDLSTTEVIDGARLLDEAFHRLYTGPDIDAEAQTINVAKGPKRPA